MTACELVELNLWDLQHPKKRQIRHRENYIRIQKDAVENTFILKPILGFPLFKPLPSFRYSLSLYTEVKHHLIDLKILQTGFKIDFFIS